MLVELHLPKAPGELAEEEEEGVRRSGEKMEWPHTLLDRASPNPQAHVLCELESVQAVLYRGGVRFRMDSQRHEPPDGFS